MKSATKNTIKSSLSALAIAGLVGCSQGGGSGSEYPSKNINLIVPFDAGGNADTQARALAPCMGDNLGQRVVVQNQPGSGGTIGTRALANAEPDGYTMSVNSVSPYVLGPMLVDNAGYTTEDLQVLGTVTAAPIVFFIAGDSKVSDIDQLVGQSKSKNISVAVPGANTLQDFMVQTFNDNYGAKFNIIPTDSMTEIIRGVNEGDYDVGVTSISLDLLPRIESGEVKVVARGGDENYEYLEGIPTYKEAGYEQLLPSTEITVPLAAPAGLPEDVADTVETALSNCLEDESVVSGLGAEIVPPEFVGPEAISDEYSDLHDAIEMAVK
ncbi:tripartite tricarboxylate transporter substrate binding protein [Brevibacterium antiquum]|uniref:Tripartite-type tricarboxylate transporter, receptor component TctC n=1 Tax=Brevibacterium antiquum CNRZ 918 TaxID=1255637 RepID=A0A2H1L080_9MICO|nr:tripartite tricarboxylate transporter substrate binding protein [Brevibacterium antiquum]SMY05400.1 Tripartite-type tricarboxylate transporter, receptor component TctC [Brevibacterium antiquum CNRZ 918]